MNTPTPAQPEDHPTHDDSTLAVPGPREPTPDDTSRVGLEAPAGSVVTGEPIWDDSRDDDEGYEPL